MSLAKRIALAFSLGLFVGINTALSNGFSLTIAVRDGLIFSVVVSIYVAIISWGIGIAEEKGYPVRGIFFLLLFLNVIGIVILLLLPNRKEKAAAGMITPEE
jgi:hypothetical protein